TITNARIIGVNGTVIERGSIVVRGGKIVSVATGAASASSGQVIDAKGMTAMPGFIDGHRHINTGPNEKAQMQALLEAGYTTVLSGGGPAEGNITLRDHIDKRVINGPRVIPSGAVRLNGTADAARADVRKLAVLGTVSFGSPVFGVFADDNKPRFRDGKAWPEGIIDGVRLGEEAGYMPVNARTIWDSGAILGYCTDTTYDPKAGLDHELKMLNVMFSMQDLIKMMGPNTASYIQMGDQLGTLEAGKLADIILIDGDPLEG